MINTDIRANDDIDGRAGCMSFRDYGKLKEYMLKNNIKSCHVFADIAGIKMTENVLVTVEDITRLEDEE